MNIKSFFPGTVPFDGSRTCGYHLHKGMGQLDYPGRRSLSISPIMYSHTGGQARVKKWSRA